MKMTRNHLPFYLIIRQSIHLSVENVFHCYHVYCIQPNVPCYHRYRRAGHSPKQQYLPGHFMRPPALCMCALSIACMTAVSKCYCWQWTSLLWSALLLASWRSCFAVLAATRVALDSSSRRFASCLLSYLLQQLSAIHHRVKIIAR